MNNLIIIKIIRIYYNLYLKIELQSVCLWECGAVSLRGQILPFASHL